MLQYVIQEPCLWHRVQSARKMDAGKKYRKKTKKKNIEKEHRKRTQEKNTEKKGETG